MASSPHAAVLLSKSDIPLHSIASREKYIIQMIKSTGMAGSVHESMSESLHEDTRYSAFTHGNGLNDYYSNQGAALKKNCNFLLLTNFYLREIISKLFITSAIFEKFQHKFGSVLLTFISNINIHHIHSSWFFAWNNILALLMADWAKRCSFLSARLHSISRHMYQLLS